MKKIVILALMTSFFTFGKSDETKVTFAAEATPEQTYAMLAEGSSCKSSFERYFSRYYYDFVSITVTNDFTKISSATLANVDPIEVGVEGTKTNITLKDGSTKDFYIAAYVAESTIKPQYSSQGYDLYFYADVGAIRPNNNASSQFASFFEVQKFTFDCLDTSHVTNMSNMFYSCNATSLDLSSFNTSNVTNMSNMFQSCSKLTSLDLSKFDTSNVNNMAGMFYGCSNLTTLDVSMLKTNKVTDMSNMFNTCKVLSSLDLTNFDFSQVTNMSSMFSYDKAITEIKFPENIDTSKVEKMDFMFSSCFELQNIDLSHFKTLSVKNFKNMFNGCISLTNLDLSNFNTSKCENFYGMLTSLEQLKTINISSFDLSAATSENNSNLFDNNCGALEVILAPKTLGEYNVALPQQFCKYGYNTLNQFAGQARISIIPNLFAERWQTLRTAGGAKGICAALVKDSETRTTYEALIKEYDAMDPNDKTAVEGMTDIEGVTIGDTMTYLKNVLNGTQTTTDDYDIVVENNTSYNLVASSDTLVVVIALLAFGLMSCLGYYIFNKRKENN